MNAPAQLVPRFGVASNQAYTLSQRITTVGREDINDIALPDSEVSRRHARIVMEDGVYTLEDLGSTNGTFIDGQRIQNPVQLRHGMTIDFGEKHRFTFVHETADNSDKTMIDPGAAASYQAATLVDQAVAENDATMLDIDPDSQLAIRTQLEEVPPPPVSPPPLPPSEAGPLPTFEVEPPEKPKANRGRLFLGIGCLFFLLVFLCGATFFGLDSYDNGSLLYCGPLQGLWESLAGLVDQSINCN